MKKILALAVAVTLVTGIAHADDLKPVQPVQKTAQEGANTSLDSIGTSAASESLGAPKDPSNVSAVAGSNSTLDFLKQKVQASYFGVYRGPGLSSNAGGLTPGIDGNPDITDPQGVESYVTTGYKFAPDWMAGVSTHFFYNGTTSMGAGNQPLDSGFTMLAPSLVISKANLVDSNGLKIKGFIFAGLPMSHYDYFTEPGNNMLTTISPTANITYDIKGTRWTLGLYSYITAYVPGPNSPDDLRTYKIYAAPYLNYQIAPTVAATLWVDLIQATRNGGTTFVGGMMNPGTDIEPGMNFDIVPGYLSVNPILNIYPGHATIASTSVQAVIIGKAF